MAQPGPLNLGGTAGTLADAIRRQAEAQAKAANEQKLRDSGQSIAPMDPLEQLTKQIQGINVAPTPYETLLQQARGTAGAQFDPMIAELNAEISRTKSRGTKNQATVKQMYNDLATDIAAQMPEITNQMSQASRETQSRYDATQNELRNQFNNQQAQQAEVLQRLGITAALPEASQQAVEDQAYFQNQSNSEEASALRYLNEMKNSDLSYNRQSASNTRLAGNNAAADIATQLEEYLQAAGGKLAGLNAGKESAIQSMLAQLQQQDSQRIAQQKESEYDRLMDMFKLQLQMREQEERMSRLNGSDALFKGTNGPPGAANYLAEVYGNGDTFTPKAIMEAITGVLSTPEVRAGKYQSPDMKDAYGNPVMVNVNNDYLTDQLRKYLQDQSSNSLTGTQFSDFDINNAIAALLAHRGSLK
ncbi:hypothetical protein ACFY7C_36650 [Streptomyces sp. NPDC012769]|uniref:hypothetical protein n=1 Tax=Streptomyces sp. NPDC012769 TaxID=3364848 RepID=UPI0036AF39C8